MREGRVEAMLFEKNDTVLFIGDSISDYERARPVGEGLFNAWGRSYVADAGSLLCCMYPELRLRIVNMGIGGNQVRDLDARWEKDVMDRKPDWVSVLIGINDVWRQFDQPHMPETHVLPLEYERTLDALINETLPRVRGMVLMTPYYMEPNPADRMRARMDEYGAIVKKLAARYGLPCVDLQARFNALFAHMHSANIAWDRVHPNLTGHMLIARALLEALEFEK